MIREWAIFVSVCGGRLPGATILRCFKLQIIGIEENCENRTGSTVTKHLRLDRSEARYRLVVVVVDPASQLLLGRLGKRQVGGNGLDIMYKHLGVLMVE